MLQVRTTIVLTVAICIVLLKQMVRFARVVALMVMQLALLIMQVAVMIMQVSSKDLVECIGVSEAS